MLKNLQKLVKKVVKQMRVTEKERNELRIFIIETIREVLDKEVIADILIGTGVVGLLFKIESRRS